MNKKIIASYLISIILIIVVLLIADLDKVIKDVISFGIVPFLIICIIYSFSFLFRAIAWTELVKPLTKLRLSDSFYIVLVGFLANNVLPLRIGELVRAYLLAKRNSIGKVRSFSTVVVNRIVEGSVLVLLFLAGFFLVETITLEMQFAVLFPALFFAALLLFFVMPDSFIRFAEKIIGRIPFISDRIKLLLGDLTIGSRAFKQGIYSQIKIWLSSIIVWVIHVVVFYIVMASLGLDFTIPQLMIIVAISNIVAMIPSAPGYLGTYEAAIVFSFAAFGLSSEAALSTAIITHLVAYVVITILGIISLNRLGVSWGEIAKVEKAN